MTVSEEMALPTVIIDMPEFFASVRRKRVVRLVWIILSTIIFSLLGALLVMEFFFGGARQFVDESIILTVKTTPENISGVKVTLDEIPLQGNPPYLIIPPSSEYHSVVVTAPGYETVTKDIKLGASQIVTVDLKKREEKNSVDVTADTAVSGTDSSSTIPEPVPLRRIPKRRSAPAVKPLVDTSEVVQPSPVQSVSKAVSSGPSETHPVSRTVPKSPMLQPVKSPMLQDKPDSASPAPASRRPVSPARPVSPPPSRPAVSIPVAPPPPPPAQLPDNPY
jgi:hypothetical protein